MKKIFYAAVVASVAFASCTKNEVRTVEDNQDRQITFQAVVHKASTKSTLTENNVAYPTDVPFGTFAYFYTTSFDNTAKTYIDNAEVNHIDGKEANVSSPVEGWTTNPAYYWPKQGKLTFYSYSPYAGLNSVTTCDATNGIKISSWDVDANQTVDVMVADRKDNQTSNGSNAGWNGVPTVFRHKLAQVVDFMLKTNVDYSGGASPTTGSKLFYVNEISIVDVKHNGSFASTVNPSSTAIGSWTPTEGKKTYTWYENANCESENMIKASGSSSPKADDSSSNCKSSTNGYLLVLPQTFTANSETSPNVIPTTGAAYIKFVYTIRTYYSSTGYTDEKVTVYKDFKSLNASGWEINKRYTYTITVSLDQIYWAPSVENWEDATAPSFTF